MAARRRPGLGDRWRGLEQRISEVTGLPETSYEREIYRETKSPYEQLSLFDELEEDRSDQGRSKGSYTSVYDLIRESSTIPNDVFEWIDVIDVSPWTPESRGDIRGPSSSTRLNGHIFIPDDPGMLIDALRRSASPSTEQIMGTVYVQWIKMGPRGNMSAYGPLSLATYIDFMDSPSKGKDVVNLPGHRYHRSGSAPNNNAWLT